MRWFGHLPKRLGQFGLLGLLVFSAACGGSSSDLVIRERRVLELREECYERLMADDRGGALGALEKIALLDPQHPMIGLLGPYVFYEERAWPEAEAWLRARLPAGPGLTLGLGRLARLMRDFAGAETRAREALDQYRLLEHIPGEAQSRLMLGGILQRTPALRDEAIAEYEAAIPLFRQYEDRLGEALVLSMLASIERLRKNFDEALSLLHQSLAIREADGNPREQANSWGAIGRALDMSKRPGEAAEAFEREFELRERIHDREGQFRTLKRLASTYEILRDEDGVLRSYSRMAELAEESENEHRLAVARFKLGRYHQNLENPDEAIEQFRLAVSTGALDEENATDAYRALGLALKQTGELSAAADALHSALRHGDRIKSGQVRRGPKARTLAALATLAHSNGELGQALLYFEQALELWREDPPDDGEVSETLNDLGMTYWRLGRGETARRYVEDSLKLARKIEDRNRLGTAQHNLALLLAEEGRTEEALTHYEASIEIRQELQEWRRVALTRHSMAGLLWKSGQREDAHRALEQALEGLRQVGDRENETFALNRSAEFLLDEGKHRAAAVRYSESIELSRRHGFSWPLYEAFAGRATALKRSGDLAAAVADLGQALDLVESLRARQETGELKMRFFAGKMALYERAAVLEAELEPGQAVGAFQFVERARARSLLDSLTESRLSAAVELSGDLAARERRLVDAVSSAALRLTRATDDGARDGTRRELDAAEGRLRSFELEIRRKAPRYSDIVYPEPITLQQTQAEVLREDETLLRYFVGDEQAMLWVIRRDGARFHRLAHPDRIAELVADFGEQAAQTKVRLGGGVAGATEGERLAEALEVAGLPAGDRLLVVPDGPLHHVPFDALRVQGRYLVEDHEIVVVPSVTTLKLMRGESTNGAAGGFFGIGDPVTGGDDPRFPPLRHSGRALERIAALFPEDQRVVLQGKQATKASLSAERLDRFRYLHFATHGWLDAARPRYFGLQLSPEQEGEAEDFLYLDEVFLMRLRAELVVLAACRSGLGELLAGEGLVGLTRGFLYAGARSLLVALWDVDDRASAEFMEAFYRALVEGREIPAALREVKLLYIHSERAAARRPHQWAPFVLIGDPTHGSTISKSKDSAGSAASNP